MLRIRSVDKYKGSTYIIDFEGCEPAFINREIVSKYNLKAGVQIPEDAWEQVIYDNNFRRARERALYLLDYRDYSYIELFKKLRENYEEDICYDVMDNLAELGIINDRRYAENLAEKLVDIKKFGYYRAVREMRQKGISKELADEALEKYEDSYSDRIIELLETKYFRKLESDNGIEKVKNALVRQGYSYSEINEAMEQFFEE
ncbi:MAG: regulatory protein RecX [Oscillospiraceae bacterium]